MKEKSPVAEEQAPDDVVSGLIHKINHGKPPKSPVPDNVDLSKMPKQIL